MKKLTLSLALFVLLTAAVFAQNIGKAMPPEPPLPSIELGGRSIRIPCPDNFTDTTALFPRIAARLIASESPLNDVLAVHVTDDILPQLKNGYEPDLPFFTKVSVLKQLKGVDVEQLEFQALAAEFEKQSPGMLQSAVRSNEKVSDDRLSKHWGTKTNLKIGETISLGHFDKQPRSISSMFLMNLEIFDRKMIVLGSMSLVNVNKRLLFVYVFRIPTSDNDEEIVTNFTKAWTAKIVSAN